MNPKGEEGEFYMKKSLLVLASIMILALCTFVACTAEVSDPYDGLTYVTFGGETTASRNLLASYEVASYDDLYWSYSAEKLDHYGTSGAATNAPVFEDSTTKGLNKTVGPFSQGKWRFTLCAYTSGTTRNEDTKVYEGSVEVSLKGQKVTVPVSVTPYGKNGSLEFKDAYFAWEDNAESSTGIPVITIVAEGTTTGQKYTLSNSFTADIEGVGTPDMKIRLALKARDGNGRLYIDEENARFDSVVADYYKCSIIAYIDIDGSQTPVFSQTLGFRVYGSATTIIKGDITEQSGTDVNFDPAKQGMAVFKGATTASVEVTPSGTDTTTVDFGANNLDNTSTYYLNVAATSVASAANKFTVSDSTKAPVAGIDLELVKVSSDGSNSKVRKFSGDAVTIKTYIEKGLTGVTVEYNGTDGEDPVVVGYNSDTGELTFTTNHFSEFYAVSNSVAVVSNETEEKGYARLVDAIDSSKDGATIKLLKNIELTESIRIGSIDYRKSLTIDFNGYTISGDSSNDSLFCVENSEVVFTGKGFIVDKCSGYGYGAIEAVGSASSESKNYTVVTVGHEITINDGMAAWINHNSNETKESTSYTSYGVVVNFYGTANRGDIEDFVFYVNGKNKETVNAPVFNIKDATINSPLSRGIFAAGYAVWNIDNTVIESKKAAIEIRAGELNIVGGTFTATADEFSCKANGNGETTVGAAIAVAQHNTKLPINVTISGGTFSGYHALSVMNPQKNEYDAIKEIEVNVTGGTLSSTKKDVEPVNYYSEFIKIGDGSSFTIRARKDGDEGNVATVSNDGRFFDSLQGAVDGIKDNETAEIVLLKTVNDGDGILIPEGNKTLTIDFNNKTYNVTKNFIKDKNSGINIGKGNHIVLKNGMIASSSMEIATLVQNYSDLTLQDVSLDGLTDNSFGQNFRSGDCSVLSCSSGKTVITGKSDIKGRSGNGFRTVDVTCLRSDSYNEVSVLFDSNYTGSVYNRVYFDSEKGTSNLEGYTHSLVIDAGNFDNATFYLQEIRGKSLFKIKNQITFSSSNASYKVVLVDEYKTLADEVIYNETSDTRYTDFHTAITNSLTSEQLRFVLKGECVTGRYCTNINGGRVVTLDLQGNRIKAHTLSDSNAMFSISDGTLNIVDSSVVKGSIDSSDNLKISYCIAVGSNGSFNVESGIMIKAAEGKKAATGWSSEIITEGYSYHSN